MSNRTDHVDRLNRSMPAAKQANLGTVIQEMIDNFNAAMAKLDADVQVGDTDYAATLTARRLGEE